MRISWLSHGLALGLAGLSVGAGAFENDPVLSPQARVVLTDFVAEYPEQRSLDRLADLVRGQALSLDMDGGGLSRRDLEIREQREAAGSVGSSMSQRLWFDLDRDGRVTRDEYRNVVTEKLAEIEHGLESDARRKGVAPDYKAVFPTYPNLEGHGEFIRLMANFDDIDRDHDAVLSLQEIHAAATRTGQSASTRTRDAYRFLAFDTDGDGNATPAEIDAAVAAYVKEKGLVTAWETMPPPPPRPRSSHVFLEPDDHDLDKAGAGPSCAFPLPSKRALLVRLGASQGVQFSNIGIAGQDKPTKVATLDIELGKAPLYIIASQQDPIIWRFTGAVGRVENFIVASKAADDRLRPAVGVVGLAASKMRGVRLGCIGHLYDSPEKPGESPIALRVRDHFGRLPDRLIGTNRLSGMTLPSGTAYRVPENRPAALRPRGDDDVEAAWTELLSRVPEGVAEIDPGTVVAYAEPIAYETLPEGAGLVQLMIEGKIVRLRAKRYAIERPMHYPSGLTSEVTFELATGVAPPTGSGGRSCIMRQGSGEAIAGHRACR